MLITATVFALAAAPALLIVQERAVPQADERVGHFVHQAMGRLAETLRQTDGYRDFARLLVCAGSATRPASWSSSRWRRSTRRR